MAGPVNDEYSSPSMDPQLEEPDLRSYLGVIARRRRLVILTTLVFLGLAVAASLIPDPQYEVRASVQTTGVSDPITALFGDGFGDLDRAAAGELAVLNSGQLRLEAARTYNGDMNEGNFYRIAANPVPGTNPNINSSVVELSLVSSDPEEAATLLNVYASTYVRQRQVRMLEALANQERLVRDLRDDLEAEIEEVRAPITEIEERQAAGTATQADLDRLGPLRGELRPELDPLYAESSELNTQINRLRFGSSATGGNAQLLSPAGVPDAPVSPNIPLNLAIGLVFGLFLGAALALVRDYFDDSVKTKELAEQVTAVATLGLIPKVDGNDELITVTQPSAPAAEAFRSLRTAVKFLALERQVRVVQVTSPSPSEGKTFCAVNLAVAFAQAGSRVVVVGADLRRPRVERILDVPLTPGLTGVLIGDVTLPQAIQTVAAVPNLSVLPAGTPPPNPSELLSGERARRLVDVLGQTYDIVVIDCPPVLPVTDGLILSRMVDTTLLVASANKTSKRSLTRAVELLRQVNAPLAGTVLNTLSADATFNSEPYRYDSVMPRRGGRRRFGADGNGGGAPEGLIDSGGWRIGRRGRGESGEWPPAGPPGPGASQGATYPPRPNGGS